MQADATSNRPGRPGISDEKWNEVLDLILGGASPREAARAGGISLTKAYEVNRNRIRRNAPVPTTEHGA